MLPLRKTICCRGRTYPVVDRWVVGRKEYLILEKLSGGFRERYKVFDPVAGPGGDLRVLQILPSNADTKQHLKVLKRVSEGNTNFPTILEYHLSDDRILVVLSWTWGEDLANRLRYARKKPRLWPSAFEAFQLYRRLSHGLCQLHHANCVHGDIKPANLVLARQPNRVVLIDFGSAWTVERTMKRTEGDGRTDGYASPEQHRAEAVVDFRSDQFSAAVVAYELLTGELPYDAMGGKAGLPEYGDAFVNSLVAPSRKKKDSRQLPGDFWQRLDNVILRSLALKPEERFPGRDPWLTELEEIDALLKLRPKLSPINRAFLGLADWFGSLFRKKSDL